MWLIECTTLQLKAFHSYHDVPYAILSHTWEEQELDFDTFKAGDGRDWKGFSKIEKCCQQARSEGLKYAWVDTCCIDKRSSAELSEAINSMFQWYEHAAVCYVYLADVVVASGGSPVINSDPAPFDVESFKASRWLTRGWTLQELLAPVKVHFYSNNWSFLGCRSNLANVIHEATNIANDVLTGTASLHSFSIACRMSWAAHRTTTREEDMAYSLLGIFRVNMPLLYGEGKHAFFRLQETIVEKSNDESIFAWTGVANGSGLLAESPRAFAGGHNIQIEHRMQSRPPYHMTNRGMAVEFQVVPVFMNTYLALLACCRVRPDGGTDSLAIFLCRTIEEGRYQRIAIDGVELPICKAPHTQIDLFAPHSYKWDTQKAQARLLHVANDSQVQLKLHGHMPRFKLSDGLRRVWQDLDGSSFSRYRYSETPPEGQSMMVNQHEVELSSFEQGFLVQGGPLKALDWMRISFNVDFEPICSVSLSPKTPSWFPFPSLLLGRPPREYDFLENVKGTGYNQIVLGYARVNPENTGSYALRGNARGLHAALFRPPWLSFFFGYGPSTIHVDIRLMQSISGPESLWHVKAGKGDGIMPDYSTPSWSYTRTERPLGIWRSFTYVFPQYVKLLAGFFICLETYRIARNMPTSLVVVLLIFFLFYVGAIVLAIPVSPHTFEDMRHSAMAGKADLLQDND